MSASANFRYTVWFYGLFALTGMTALQLQVAWKRDLTLIFGASHTATAIVLAAFMGGLALGGWLLGRYVERVERPLRLYALLELAVAGCALLMPLALMLVEQAYFGLVRGVGEATAWLNTVRASFALLVLLAPTFFMGGTLPILAKALSRHPEAYGVQLPRLYGINTSGAVLGTLLSGFVLLPWLGVLKTELTAVAINSAVGLFALWLDGRLQQAERAAPAQESAPAALRAASSESKGALQLVFYATALCGFCALALEVLWTRALVIVLGATAYNFALMLSAFLSGIALGGLLAQWRPIRRAPLSLLQALVLVLIGACSLAATQYLPALPELSLRINQFFYTGFEGVRPLTSFGIAFAVMFVPALLFGVAFPLAARARSVLQTAYGQATGESLGINTLGSVLGALLAGFVFIPWLGLQESMLWIACLPIAYGVLLLAAWVRPRLQRAWIAPALALAGLAASLSLPMGLPGWDIYTLGTFRNNQVEAYVAADGTPTLDARRGFSSLVYYQEGRGATVSVTQSAQMRAILINGKTVATDSQQGLGLQKMMGHLPALLHPDPQEALVIGLGAGVTLGAVTIHPEVEAVRLVEIEPAVLGGAKTFDYINNNALQSEKLSVRIQDGRNYLRTTTERYDLITADPIHPWAAGSTYLYTREYYRDALARLNPGGVMAQWLPLYELSLEDVQCIAATFMDVFRHVQLWQIYHDTILIGSDQPLRIDRAQLAQRLDHPPVAQDLRIIDVTGPGAFLALFVADQNALGPFCQGAAINTDDNLYLEFATPYNLGTDTLPGNLEAIHPLRQSPAQIVINELSEKREAHINALQALEVKLLAAVNRREPGQTYEHQCERDQIAQWTRRVEAVDGYRRAERRISQLWLECGMAALGEQNTEEAQTAFEKAIEAFPENGQAYNQLATLAAQAGNLEQAQRFAEAATQHAPRIADAWINRGAIAEAAGQAGSAERFYRQALEVRPHYWFAHEKLGRLYIQMGRGALAAMQFENALAEKPDALGAWFGLAEVARRAQRYQTAIAALKRVLAHSPGNTAAHRQLADLYQLLDQPQAAQYHRDAANRSA